MGLIILNAILATGLLYSITPFLTQIHNKFAGYHNISLQTNAGNFPENGNSPNYNTQYQPDIINRNNFPETNDKPNYPEFSEQNPQDYPSDQAQYPEHYSEENPIDNSQQLPIDNSQQLPLDNSQQLPIDNSQQLPIDNSQQLPIDNSQQLPIDNSQQLPIDNSEQRPIDNSQQLPVDHSQQLPIDNSQEFPFYNSQESNSPIDTSQQHPTDNLQQNPEVIPQQYPIDKVQQSIDNTQENPQNPLDNLQPNPESNSQQNPIDNSGRKPIDNSQDNPIVNGQDVTVDGQFVLEISEQNQESEYQMDVDMGEVSSVTSRLLSQDAVSEDSTVTNDFENSNEEFDEQPLHNLQINPKDCGDKSCILTAANYLKHMDETVNPCENFYKFACGNYAIHNPLKGDDTMINEITKAKDAVELNLKTVLEQPISEDEPEHFKKLKQYYKSCINKDKIDSIGLDVIKSNLENLGGWPVAGKDNDHDWVYVVYGLNKLGISPNYLFEFNVDSDYKNTSIRILSLSPPDYPLQRATVVNGKSDKNVMAYLNYMIETAKLFGATDEDARNDMELVLDFEIALAKNSRSIEEIRSNLTASYNIYSIKELEKEFQDFPWFIYINTLTPKTLEISKEMKVILTEPKYARELLILLKTTPKRTIINYLLWRTIYDLAKFLNSDMQILNQNFYSKIYGKQTQSPRHTECIDILRDRLNPLIGALYVQKYFNIKSKEAAIVLTKYIKNTFKTIINRTNWSAKDKAIAVEKAEAIHEHIGFPEELLDNNQLNSVYGMLDVNEDDFLYSSLKLSEFKRDFEFNRLFEPVNKTYWIDHAYSADANAYYNVAENSIILPAGILQGSYFNSHVPMFVNFAAIGSVIGHEITHGFDDVGHQFNKNGDLGNIWSEEAERDFNEKKQCVIDQFNNFTVFGKPYNGARTVGENLADFGGQKTAYISYIKWMRKYGAEPKLPGLNYTIKQQYWIAGANIWCSNEREETLKYKATVETHSLEEFRVNAPLSNIPNFALDFNCPLGSKMNPEKKCTPW